MGDRNGRAKRRAKQRAAGREEATQPQGTKAHASDGYIRCTVVVEFPDGFLRYTGRVEPLNIELRDGDDQQVATQVAIAVASFLRASAHHLPPGADVNAQPDGTGSVTGSVGRFAWRRSAPTA